MGAPLFAARLHRPGELDGAAEQQQLLGGCRLAGVGMRDDREGASTRYGAVRFGHGTLGGWEADLAQMGMRPHDVKEARKAPPFRQLLAGAPGADSLRRRKCGRSDEREATCATSASPI